MRDYFGNWDVDGMTADQIRAEIDGIEATPYGKRSVRMVDRLQALRRALGRINRCGRFAAW